MRFRSVLPSAALAALWLLASSAVFAQLGVGISIHIAPPVLPVYVQPPLPAPGYLWAPGYWAWGPDGYFWVPGTWVEPPRVGLLWTPGYWGWADGAYVWHQGYWGPRVGFYGGIDYGFGYGGVGYTGGRWSHDVLFYNRAVNRFAAGLAVPHVYSAPVAAHPVNRVAFNGGTGGIQARPTPQQLAAERAPHLLPVAAQRAQEQAAGRNPALRASVNHGHPSIAATARPGQFSTRDVVGARGASPAGRPPGFPGRAIPERAGPQRSEAQPHALAHAAAAKPSTHGKPARQRSPDNQREPPH